MLNSLTSFSPDLWRLATSLQAILETMALLGAAGSVLFLVTFFENLGDDERNACRRSLRLFVLLGLLALVAGLALMVGVEARNPAAMLRLPAYGTALRMQAGDLFVMKVLGLFLTLLARRRSLVALAFAVVGAMMLCVVPVLTGHAGLGLRRIEWTLLIVLHVLVAAFWFASCSPLRSITRRKDPRSAEQMIRRWLRLMRWLVLLLIASGLTLTFVLDGSFRTLQATLHGQWTLAKMAAFVILFLYAFWNRRRHLALMASGDILAATGLRRALAREFWLMLAVIAISVEMGQVALGR